MTILSTDTYRFERKFVIPIEDQTFLEQVVKTNPFIFS